ncbi:MAG: hypothetical protein JWO58_2419, partial [Chitinophagaceae bacterium]|nr:hypothetical protein [Chitinophagaceae bacterium]
MNKNVFLLAIVIWATSITANAQVLNKNTTFKIGGLGRSILTSDKLSGDLVQGDTLSPKKGLGGYTLFDMNMDLTINKIFNANAILRVKNPYGSFYGQDTKFEFRQLQFRGQIGRTLKYELGDIYVGMTPYTLYNSKDPSASRFESDVFKARRDILEYENFYVGNKWRLQGLQLNYGLDSVLSMQRIALNVFGIRTNVTNDGSVPDRILFGGRLDVIQSSKFRVGLNAVNFSDLAVSQSNISIRNEVYTADAALTLQNDVFLLGVGIEGGTSAYNYQNKSGDTSNSNHDFFVQPDLKIGVKPVKLVVNGSYRNVGAQFNSPTAQTQRVNAGVNPSIFPLVNQNTTARGQMMFDRFTNETGYNRSIVQTLGVFLPQYGNITPYGQATPNRVGFSGGIATDTSLKNFAAEVQVDLLSEINGVGTTDLRKFTGIRGGFVINVGGLAKLNRVIDLSAGIKNETTKRDGPAAVDFKSTIIDAGLSIETLRKVDIIGGIKLLTAKGNEYLPLRNNYNQVVQSNGIDNSGGNGYQYD